MGGIDGRRIFFLDLPKNYLKQVLISALIIVMLGGSWLLMDHHYLRFAPDHDHTVFHTDFSEHMAATIALKDVSNAERIYRWVAGIRMVAERPVTGFGPNSFYPQYRPYTLEIFKTWVSNNPEHSSVHNYFLLTLLEQGIPGLILFGLLYLAMLFKAQRLYHSLQNRFYRTIAMTVALMLVMIGVINAMSDLIETDKIGSLFWLCLGTLFVLETQWRQEKQTLA